MKAQWLQPSRVAMSSIRGPAISNQPGSRKSRFVLGDPGRCPSHSSLTICLFDDSGSVAGPIGTDPVSNRYGKQRRRSRPWPDGAAVANARRRSSTSTWWADASPRRSSGAYQAGCSGHWRFRPMRRAPA